jgi:hypothetical protein
MYIRQPKNNWGGYYIGSEQHSRQADYLMLASSHSNKELYACVRKVAMSQCGHFMMGTARVGGQSICVSGPIGNDGLPLNWEDLTDRAKQEFVRVPDDVATAYWADDGWNDVGKARGVLTEYGRSIS